VLSQCIRQYGLQYYSTEVMMHFTSFGTSRSLSPPTGGSGPAAGAAPPAPPPGCAASGSAPSHAGCSPPCIAAGMHGERSGVLIPTAYWGLDAIRRVPRLAQLLHVPVAARPASAGLHDKRETGAHLTLRSCKDVRRVPCLAQMFGCQFRSALQQQECGSWITEIPFYPAGLRAAQQVS